MRAVTHILSGAGGTSEFPWMRKRFQRDAAAWDARRDHAFGYSRMDIHNATHLRWRQIQADPLNPSAAPVGSVVDDVWLIQDHHGPFV